MTNTNSNTPPGIIERLGLKRKARPLGVAVDMTEEQELRAVMERGDIGALAEMTMSLVKAIAAAQLYLQIYDTTLPTVLRDETRALVDDAMKMLRLQREAVHMRRDIREREKELVSAFMNQECCGRPMRTGTAVTHVVDRETGQVVKDYAYFAECVDPEPGCGKLTDAVMPKDLAIQAEREIIQERLLRARAIGYDVPNIPLDKKLNADSVLGDPAIFEADEP